MNYISQPRIGCIFKMILREKLFWKIVEIYGKTSPVKLCFFKVLGLESAKLLKKDFFKGVILEFFKHLLNSSSGGYLLEADARRYSLKKMFLPNDLQFHWIIDFGAGVLYEFCEMF